MQLRGLLEQPPDAGRNVSLHPDAAKEPASIPASSQPEILRIRGAGIVLSPALVEAVVCGDDKQGLALYASDMEFIKQAAQLLVVYHKALGVLCAVLARAMA